MSWASDPNLLRTDQCRGQQSPCSAGSRLGLRGLSYAGCLQVMELAFHFIPLDFQQSPKVKVSESILLVYTLNAMPFNPVLPHP